ncbi:MAG: DUF4340 domain-containing protein [Almyronema sp.]
MKLQRSTVILLLVALGLGGVVLISELQRPADDTETLTQTQSSDRLFEFEEADVQTLVVTTEDTTLRFERDEADVWQMLEPETAPAEPAAIAFLLNLLRTESAQQTTTLTPANQAEFGLASPTATIEFTLADETTHTLVLGGEDFSGGAVYALIDPETVPLPDDADEVEVQVVPIDFVNAVNRPIEEWQIATAPPDSEASTPVATPDEAADPVVETDAPPAASDTAPESP